MNEFPTFPLTDIRFYDLCLDDLVDVKPLTINTGIIFPITTEVDQEPKRILYGTKVIDRPHPNTVLDMK
jgi:hypothetical protein